jgi:hypothetical protein
MVYPAPDDDALCENAHHLKVPTLPLRVRAGGSLMSLDSHADNLASAVRYALETTRATAVCPFHADVTIRVGDDAAETHAYIRAHRSVKSDGTTWEREVLLEEIKRQLSDAADGCCPHCAHQGGRQH